MEPASEVRIRIPDLHRLPAALIRVLADAGMGGPQMDQVLSAAVQVECVGCGIRMPVKELMALRPSLLMESNPKMDRIRLGYCARHSCSSQFYLIRVGQDVGLESGPLLERLTAEIANSETESDEELVDDAPPRNNPYAGFLKKVAMRTGVAAMVVAAFIWWREGAYIPGLSKKPQIFMPVADVTEDSRTEPGSHVPTLPSPLPPGRNLNAPDRSN